jgi:acyl carrier protein
MSRPYVAPRTPIERRLAEIWSQVLDIDCVGINDNYLDLGGDSIMAVVLLSMIVAEFSVSMPTATIIRAPTIAQLAQEIDRAKRALPPSRM